MNYAEVTVNSPFALRRSFCYSVPADLNIDIGHAVWVPFGSKTLQGIVVSLSDSPSFEATKEIDGLIYPIPLLSQAQVQTAIWLSTHYLASLFDCVALMLPPGFERRLNTYLEISSAPAGFELSPDQEQIVHLIETRDSVDLKAVERFLGQRKAQSAVEKLVRLGLVVKRQRLGQPKIKPKVVSCLNMKIDRTKVLTEITNLTAAGAVKEAAVLELLMDEGRDVPLSEVRKTVSSPATAIQSLIQRELVSVDEVVVRRDPLSHIKVMATLPPTLTPSQEEALLQVRSCLDGIRENKGTAVCLLHGVTGSGKTEIYLRTLAEVVSSGRKGICLVPEIALTPQTIERFASRFPGRVAVVHSGLSLGEQFDEWYRIKEGGCDVVIGPRSALFAPQPDLGLIIIDEEHEWTYKQSDKSPRYHTRDAALKLAAASNALVILGSATPDVETYFRATRGDYRLIELRERITPYGRAPLPDVNIVDMKEELRAGNRSLFSRFLTTEMKSTLARNEQVLLFLNRRGAATFVECRKCGFVFRCSRCSAALNYHSISRKIVCHHCNYSVSVPINCPQCLGNDFRFMGIGTQKLEEEVRSIFPEARILRWDSDAASKRRAHEELFDKVRRHETDILIGTQMVAKGLDLPEITLAGVISADLGLTLPDFKAGERTFQLLCQVAGRAGRGYMPGKVIIQTYCPEHYAVQAASRHDYETFYEKELEYRREFGYPPFSELACLTFSHTNEGACLLEVERMSGLIEAEKDRRGSLLRLIGPMPAFIPRVRGHYRWQLVLCGLELDDFLADISFPRGWTVDVDPISMV
jgi:primosomal protein N' (replication factor Y)